MDVQIDWDFIKAQLLAGWRELAVERGLIRPQPPQLHAKVTDIEQVLRPLLLRIGLESSLQTAVSTTAMAKELIAAEAGGKAAEAAQLLDLSAPALHYWERKLPGYLSELLARMIGSAELFAPARWHGYEIVLVDGTTVTRPGADGTTARVLYALRGCSGNCSSNRSHARPSPRRSLFPPQPSAPPSSPPPSETREKLRHLGGRIATEMWPVTVLLYQAIHAALLPIRLHDLPRVIEVFLEHIGRRNEKKRPKQTERFLAQLGLTLSAPPPAHADGAVSPPARASP